MKVVDGLAAVAPGVDYDSVAGGFQALVAGDLSDGLHEPLHVVGFVDFVNSGDVFSWNDQNVRRRLRVDIAKREKRLAIENDLGGDFATDYFAEKAVFHSNSTHLAALTEKCF